MRLILKDMRKHILFIFCMAAMVASAQSKITFEDNTLNGAAAIYGGSVAVVANPVTTGINTSANCLDVVNNGYAPVKFSNFSFAAGTASAYPYVKVKFKIAYKGYNGGSDLDYPQIDVYSSATTPVLDATEKLGSIGSGWGSHTSDSLVWKSAEFTMSSSALASVPGGILVLKVAKSKCEYLLDDIELVPSPLYNSNVITLENFENAQVGDVSSFLLLKYWSTTSTVGTASVDNDPVSASSKVLKITPTDYNGVVNFNVTLPNSKTLDAYDRLYFDLYFNSSNGLYAQPYIYAGSTLIYQVSSGYPSQGTNAVWNTKDYELSGMPASNNFTLKIGYTSNNSVTYYLDNVKLHLKESGTGVNSVHAARPLVIYLSGNTYKMNMIMDRVQVLDVQGRELQNLKSVDQLDATKLPSGAYVVKASVGSDTYTAKIVK